MLPPPNDPKKLPIGIIDQGNSSYDFRLKKFGDAYNLCPTEPFSEQLICANCSGFLVAPDIVATAAHCIFEEDEKTKELKEPRILKPVSFVFGFRMQDQTTLLPLRNSEVYEMKCVLSCNYDYKNGKKTDWALVKLKRPVVNHTISEVRHSGKIADNHPIHVLGHPAGLPLKYAGGAKVQENVSKDFFACNSDTYGGNSGSPIDIFRNRRNGQIERPKP